MQYKGKIDKLLEEYNKEGRHNRHKLEVYQESGMYTILHWGRRCSPVMTVKECYKALETLIAVL